MGIRSFFLPVSADRYQDQQQKQTERAESQAATAAAIHEVAAAQRPPPEPKPGPGRPRKTLVVPDSPVKKKARTAKHKSARQQPKTNWWQPVLIDKILRSVQSHNSVCKGVKALKASDPAVFKRLDPHTVSAWFEKKQSVASPFVLTAQAQQKLSRGLPAKPGAGRQGILSQVSSLLEGKFLRL